MTAAAATATAKDFKLELVQVLFRHGARTCSECEAKLPIPAHVDHTLQETYGPGQLTNIGKAQAYKLGQALRNRYNDFLGATCQPSDLYACSSDYDRTKMSLQLVLAGLYPSVEQPWNSKLAWSPLPTHYVPRELDVLLQGFEKSRYKKLLNDVLKSPDIDQLLEELMEFSKFFEEKDVFTIKKYGLIACLGIFNVFNVHKVEGARLPDWYTDELMKTLQNYVIEYFDIKSRTREMMKLSIGPLIKKFIDNMNINSEMNNPRKIYLYSGHEMNIAPFTRAHNIKVFKYPDFANAVILEKLRDPQNNRLYVRMLCWTGKNDEFTPLKLENFEDFCPIEEYLKIVKDVVPSEEEMEDIFNDRSVELKEIYVTDFVFRPKYKQ